MNSAFAYPGSLMGTLLLSGLGLAQSNTLETARLARDLPLLDARQVSFDEPQEGSLWAMGATYKVRFGPEGTTYVPRLDPTAPRNMPVELALQEITVGGEALDLSRAVEPVRTGDTVSFQHGIVEERYELEPEHMEQLFVFAEPVGSGDIVIRIGAQTELARRAEPERLLFEHELGHVSYTKAVAVDTRGTRQSLETHFDAGGIEIHVPASLVAAAAYPLTIDPVVTTFSLPHTSGGTPLNPDVAYDATFDTYLAVWEVSFSSTDVDIRAQYVDSAGDPIGNGFWIDSTTTSWANPAVAGCNDENLFMVVAERGTGDSEIWGRTVTADSGALIVAGAQFLIAGHGISPTDKAHPDIGGDQRINPLGGTSFLVVYEQENFTNSNDRDINRRMVTAEFAPTVGPAAAVHNTSNLLTNPCVSKTNGPQQNGSQQSWTVVWESNAGFAFQDVYGAEINPNGTLTVPAFPINTTLSNDYNPAVSTPIFGQNGREYLVAYQHDTGNGDSDIRIARMRTGGVILSNANLTGLEGNPNAAGDQYEPAVESEGCNFVVAYSDSTSLQNTGVYASTLAPMGNNGVVLKESRVQLGSFSGFNSGVSLASVRGAAGALAPVRVFAIWRYHNFIGNGNGVRGALYDLPGPANDCCQHAQNIGGTGIFDFDNTDASTTAPDSGACNAAYQVWFRWSAPSAGLYSISTCGLASFDTEIAVFAGSCPVGPPLDCDDDACGAQSQVLFNASAFASYRICVGSDNLGGDTGAGQFQIRKVSNGGLGVPYCTSAPSSVSAAGSTISAFGSTSTGANDLVLLASPLPIQVPGIFYFGVQATEQPFGDGFRCVGLPTFRLPLVFSNAIGDASFVVNNTVYPASELDVGLTRFFQFWHRDPSGPGGTGFNLSNGLELTFVP